MKVMAKTLKFVKRFPRMRDRFLVRGCIHAIRQHPVSGDWPSRIDDLKVSDASVHSWGFGMDCTSGRLKIVNRFDEHVPDASIAAQYRDASNTT